MEIYSGRPLRIIKTEYSLDWEKNRQAEMQKLLAEGTLPHERDLKMVKDKVPGAVSEALLETGTGQNPMLCGQVAGNVKDILTAQQIVDEMVTGAVSILQSLNSNYVQATAGASASKL